jgi:hypothetical protein
MVRLGFISHEDLHTNLDNEWLPEHLVHLGHETFTIWQKERETKRMAEKKARQTHSRKIDQFLNRRLP